jgi:DNA-directed RNA polymerase specialized sigma24 family protein
MQNLPKVKILVNLEKNLINKLDIIKKYDKMPPTLRSFVRSYFLGMTQIEIQDIMSITVNEYKQLKQEMINILND